MDNENKISINLCYGREGKGALYFSSFKDINNNSENGRTLSLGIDIDFNKNLLKINEKQVYDLINFLNEVKEIWYDKYTDTYQESFQKHLDKLNNSLIKRNNQEFKQFLEDSIKKSKLSLRRKDEGE